MKIKRSIFNKLKTDFSLKEATILVGPRQVGKTHLLHQLENYAKKASKKTHFFDLEQPAQLALFNQSEEKIIELLQGAGEVIFIDEFQYLKNASKIFKALYDQGKGPKIFASGSSALEIHSHLKESLAGRKFLYHIYPCSFEEISQVIQNNTLHSYCLFGGMPGTTHLDNDERKKQLLQDILQSYILKDIKSLLREENLRAFNHLLFLLADAQGSVISVESLARDVGLSAPTISSYLDTLAQTYVNFPVYSYSKNLGNELRKSKKFYFYDLGIRNALLKNFAALTKREDAGCILESFVFLELQRKLNPETEIRFWRLKSGEEVDFIWIKNQKAFPIEVKFNWERKKIPNGLVAFLKRYPETSRAFVVSQQSAKDITYEKTTISFISFDEISKSIEEI